MRVCPKCDAVHTRNHAYCKDCHAASMREWRKSHPLSDEQRRRDNARSYAGVYLRRGKLERSPCRDCGVDEAEMHIPDYSKPLDIIWLCRDCRMELLAGQKA